MKNTRKKLEDVERNAAKGWYHDTIRNGDLMVTGYDWEYNMIQAEQAGMEWLMGRQAGLLDVSRFFGVPADLIDAAVSGQSITYANITQRNLQFLIMNLGPAVIRREKNLSKLLPAPRYVKLNTDALLRMDPAARQALIRDRIETWQITNTEARALDESGPLTPEQRAEMIDIYGRPNAAARTLPLEMGSPTTDDAKTLAEGKYPPPPPPPAPAPPAIGAGPKPKPAPAEPANA
jgi:phage portal protein BeeE